jgi:sugar phosphate isomerase/epimerase
MGKYHLGLVSISFRKHSPEEILQAMQQSGLSCIEWGSDVHAPKDDIRRLDQLVELQKQYGITCCSYGSYFTIGITPIETLIDCIRAAKRLGTRIVRLWPYTKKNSEEFTPEEREVFFDECRRCAAIAQREDVVLCMECHNKTYTNCKESALELMQAVNSPHFRMYWQPNQYRSREENCACAELLGSYTEHVHVFHWLGDERLPLMQGVDRWREYLAQLGGSRCLLLEFMPDKKTVKARTFSPFFALSPSTRHLAWKHDGLSEFTFTLE